MQVRKSLQEYIRCFHGDDDDDSCGLEDLHGAQGDPLAGHYATTRVRPRVHSDTFHTEQVPRRRSRDKQIRPAEQVEGQVTANKMRYMKGHTLTFHSMLHRAEMGWAVCMRDLAPVWMLRYTSLSSPRRNLGIQVYISLRQSY